MTPTSTPAGVAGTPKPHESTPLPWRVCTNPGDGAAQPAFPYVEDSSDRPHGESIIAMPLGFSEVVKQNADYIVHSVNTHAALEARVGSLEAAIQRFEDKPRGIPQAHMAAELVRELRKALQPQNGEAV